MARSARNEHIYARIELASQFRRHAYDRRAVSVGVAVYCGRSGTSVHTPDVSVLKTAQRAGPVPAQNMLLAAAVVVPGQERQWRQQVHDYADSEIEWSLTVQETPEGYSAQLHRHAELGRYELHCQAPAAGVLPMPHPFDFRLDLEDLAF